MDIHCTMWKLLSKPRMAGCMSAAIFQRENAFPPSFHVWFVWSFTHIAKLGSVCCTHTERCEAKQAPGIEETCRTKMMMAQLFLGNDRMWVCWTGNTQGLKSELEAVIPNFPSLIIMPTSCLFTRTPQHPAFISFTIHLKYSLGVF